MLPARHRRVPGFQPKDLSPGLEAPLRLRDYQMDECFSFLVEVEGLRLLNWRSVRREAVPAADVLLVGPHDGRSHYRSLLEPVQPRLVIPVHWDDFFHPLSAPIRPCWRAPRWAIPPAGRVNLANFSRMIEQIDPQLKVFVPEILQSYDLRRCPAVTLRS